MCSEIVFQICVLCLKKWLYFHFSLFPCANFVSTECQWVFYVILYINCSLQYYFYNYRIKQRETFIKSENCNFIIIYPLTGNVIFLENPGNYFRGKFLEDFI